MESSRGTECKRVPADKVRLIVFCVTASFTEKHLYPSEMVQVENITE
jgi:hypothetical protein